jgi:hypothetical protein
MLTGSLTDERAKEKRRPAPAEVKPGLKRVQSDSGLPGIELLFIQRLHFLRVMGNNMLVHLDQTEMAIELGDLQTAESAVKDKSGGYDFGLDYFLKLLHLASVPYIVPLL